MKTKIFILIIFSGVTLSFASTRMTKNNNSKKTQNVSTVSKSAKSGGFVSEEL
jgi:hypothetical protein